MSILKWPQFDLSLFCEMENKCFQEHTDKNYPPLRLTPEQLIKTIFCWSQLTQLSIPKLVGKARLSGK